MGPPHRLTGFGELQAENLAEYATEKAWHHQWRAQGSETRGEEDRGLAAGALFAGVAEGGVQGVQALAIDTLLNKGTQHIPYASGFIAMGQIAYDHQAWYQQSVVQGVGGKVGDGWALLGSPDWLDKLEGVISIFDGLNQIVSLLSTICMIVAAATFLLSFIPGLQWLMPFAAMTANWGLLLGNVNTYVGIILSALRLLLIAARSVQIIACSADPTEQRRRAARLRETSRQFFQEYTLRRGARYRDRNAQERRERATGQAESPPTSAPRGSAVESAIGIVGGGDAGSMRQQGSTVVSNLGAARDYTAAWAQPVGGEGGMSRQQWLRNLQQAQAGGGETPRPAALNDERMRAHAQHEDLPHEQAQARARTAETEQALADAVTRRAAAQMELDAVQGEHDSARAQLGQDRPADVRVRVQETDVARAGVAAAERHKEALREQLSAAEYVRDARSAESARVSRNRSSRRERAEAAYEDVRRLRSALAQASKDIGRARRRVRDAEAATEQARLAAIDERTGGGLDDARRRRDESAAGQRARQSEHEAETERDRMLSSPEEHMRRRDEVDRESGWGAFGRSLWFGGAQTELDFIVPRRAGQGWDGNPQTSGYGHQGTGGVVTGQATPIITGPLEGIESRIGWDPLYGAFTDAHGGGDGQSDAAMGEAHVSATMHLPDPPEGRESTIEEAAADYNRADDEIRQLAFQAREARDLRAEMGDEASGLEAAQRLAAANEQALAANREELAGVCASQEELAGRVAQHGASTSAMGAAERPGAALEFVQSFVGLMGRIPGEVVPNAGAGQAGAQRMGRAMEAGPQGAQEGAANTSAAEGGVTSLREGASRAAEQHDEADRVLQEMRDAFAADRTEFQSSGEVLHTVHESARSRIGELEAIKIQSHAAQDAAAAELASWAQEHRAARSGADAAHGIAPRAG